MSLNPTQRRIAEALTAAGLEDAEALAAFTQPSLRLHPTPCELASLPLGASRFGGAPDVPADFDWPGAGEPLAFVAQINLAELPASELPSVGWLVFFYD